MKKLLYGFLIAIAILGTMYACMDLIWGDMCENSTIEEKLSPNKKFKAIIFTRDCGATTGYSTQLSIIETSGELDNETGNVLIMSDKVGDGLSFDNGGAKVQALWTSDNSLTIYIDERTKFTRQKDEIEDIKITYERLAE
jgi:hypothetical protein